MTLLIKRLQECLEFQDKQFRFAISNKIEKYYRFRFVLSQLPISFNVSAIRIFFFKQTDFVNSYTIETNLLLPIRHNKKHKTS